MPRFRRRGSSGDCIKAEAVDGYHLAGDRLIRKPIPADKKESSDNTSAPPVPALSLSDTRERLLSQANQVSSAPASRPTNIKVRQGKSLDAAYIEFQDQLRKIDSTTESIETVFESFGPCARVLSKSMRKEGLATLTWLGAEFAENLLAKLHHQVPKDGAQAPANPGDAASAKATLDKDKYTLSNAFAEQALSLLVEGKLSPDGFKALIAGFAAGMRGVAQDAKITAPLTLGKPDFAEPTWTALQAVNGEGQPAGKTHPDIATALIAAANAQTLPAVIKALGNWVEQKKMGASPPANPKAAAAPSSKPNTKAPSSSNRPTPPSSPINNSAPLHHPSQPIPSPAVASSVHAWNTNVEKLETAFSNLQATTGAALEGANTQLQRLQRKLDALKAKANRETKADLAATDIQQAIEPLNRSIEGHTQQIRLLTTQLSEAKAIASDQQRQLTPDDVRSMGSRSLVPP